MLSEDSNIEEPAQKEAGINEDDHTLPQHALWVEKYSPRHFTELLSDDVSRNVLFIFLVDKCISLVVTDQTNWVSCRPALSSGRGQFVLFWGN